MKKHIDIEESLRMAEGNIKHEGMYLMEEERELIREKARGNLTQKQFMDELIKLHSKKRDEIVKVADNVEKDAEQREISYDIKEEQIITPEN